MTNGYVHIPVMLEATIANLAIRPGGRYIDGTFGRGGHSRAILERGGSVLGIDRDADAIAAGERMRAEFGGRLELVRGRHGDLGAIAGEKGWANADGVLLDLGVSSPQLDEPGRGFSFQHDGPLDMRMDCDGGETAADLVNCGDAAELERIFRDFGEERQARRIAQAIVRRVAAGRRFERTLELADFVEQLIGRRSGRHPATRVFQALRMAVNDEVGELARALEGALVSLKPGGRLAVITFESITDRIVKRFFAAHVGRMVSLQQGGARWEGQSPAAVAVTHRALAADENEISINPRSRSAKLRVIARKVEDHVQEEP